MHKKYQRMIVLLFLCLLTICLVKINTIVSDDENIRKTIPIAGDEFLHIDAPYPDARFEQARQYGYILLDITEDTRAELFTAVFAEKAADAEYDGQNDVWTLTIDPAVRNYFLYHLSYSNGGATIGGETIMILMNRYYDLYPFADNRLPAVTDSTVRFHADEAANICAHVVERITTTGDYALDYIQAYGNEGRRPYLKLVFKRMVDGMPITAYNDLHFLVDDEGIEQVKGSLFLTKALEKPDKILSLAEALQKFVQQADHLTLCEQMPTEITEITLEYLVIAPHDGEPLVTPIWRFYIGADADERNFYKQQILAIDALNGELIWEERGETL